MLNVECWMLDVELTWVEGLESLKVRILLFIDLVIIEMLNAKPADRSTGLSE